MLPDFLQISLLLINLNKLFIHFLIMPVTVIYILPKNLIPPS